MGSLTEYFGHMECSPGKELTDLKQSLTHIITEQMKENRKEYLLSKRENSIQGKLDL